MKALRTTLQFALLGSVACLIGALLAGLALICVAAAGGSDDRIA